MASKRRASERDCHIHSGVVENPEKHDDVDVQRGQTNLGRLSNEDAKRRIRGLSVRLSFSGSFVRWVDDVAQTWRQVEVERAPSRRRNCTENRNVFIRLSDGTQLEQVDLILSHTKFKATA